MKQDATLGPRVVSSAALRVRPRSRRRAEDLWKVLPRRAKQRGNLFEIQLGRVERCGENWDLRKFCMFGSFAGGAWMRLGLFAGLHGDEPSGSHALTELIAELHERPELARGLELHIYPLCNPSGYSDNTRWARGGPDLNREFWNNSREPEVRILEQELRGLQFDGIISLHSDDTSNGVYGYVGGAVLTKHLLEPALTAASEFLPRNQAGRIDGWPAQEGVIEEGYSGVLSAPADQQPRPFEIVFETPALAETALQVAAQRAALLAIFDAAAALRAHAADI